MFFFNSKKYFFPFNLYNKNLKNFKKLNFGKLKFYSSWKNIQVPIEKLEVSFARSGGAGGQNVNKLNTKVEYRFKLDNADWISEEIKIRLKELYPNKITNEGDFFITSQEHRTQEENRKEATKKLQMMIFEASLPKQERIMEPIVEPDHKKEQRLKEKKQRGKFKSMRTNKNDKF